MGRVIDFYTRKDVTDSPRKFSKEEGEDLIVAILNHELSLPTNCFHSSELIDNVVMMIENCTGASRYEAMDKLYANPKRPA